jgi:predicted nucleic acid-binding protein
MPLVIDASIVHDWALEEHHPVALAVRERLRDDTAIAPSLWWFEVRNGLIVAERRGQSAEHLTAAFLQRLSRFSVTIDSLPSDDKAMTLARRHRLTVYDAAYLELALRERLELATLDAALADAARREGVVVIGDPA